MKFSGKFIHAQSKVSWKFQLTWLSHLGDIIVKLRTSIIFSLLNSWTVWNEIIYLLRFFSRIRNGRYLRFICFLKIEAISNNGWDVGKWKNQNQYDTLYNYSRVCRIRMSHFLHLQSERSSSTKKSKRKPPRYLARRS